MPLDALLKRLLASAAAPAAVFVVAGSAAGAVGETRVDQEQLQVDVASESVLAIGDANVSRQQVAQTVTAGVSGELVEVRMPVFCEPSTTLIVEIEDDAPGPSGDARATSTVPGASLTGARGVLRPLPLAAPLPIPKGDSFAVVLRSPGFCTIEYGPHGDPYSAGAAWIRYFDAGPAAWGRLGDPNDFAFQTVMRVDDEAPRIIARNVRARTRGRSATPVRYTVTVRDNIDPPERLAVSCRPRSGARFKLGSTRVRCVAADQNGNRAIATFRVVVTRARAPRR